MRRGCKQAERIEHYRANRPGGRVDIRSDAWYHQRLRLNQDLGAMDFLLKKNIFEPGPFFSPFSATPASSGWHWSMQS